MKFLAILLFFKGAELIWGKMPGAAVDEKGCAEIVAAYIQANIDDINKALADGATPKMYCIPIPDSEVKS